IQGLRGRRLTARADELLGRFDLAGAAGRLVRTYSGGMQRRLDVALGLINRPQVLFLDEPTAGLDLESRSAMWEEIGRLAAEDGAALLAVLAALDDAGLPVRAASVARPSLDDVYLRHAGRRFADADQYLVSTASNGGAR